MDSQKVKFIKSRDVRVLYYYQCNQDRELYNECNYFLSLFLFNIYKNKYLYGYNDISIENIKEIKYFIKLNEIIIY